MLPQTTLKTTLLNRPILTNVISLLFCKAMFLGSAFASQHFADVDMNGVSVAFGFLSVVYFIAIVVSLCGLDDHLGKTKPNRDGDEDA
ncbi:hypothetical protein MHM89_04535 [Pseudoalteromonas sp. CNC9-20]|uniref:hypothetical protein n=1 Tax=Pseudoalteromonas sp. CNC9-20 TaxID=2917750 RepID=UPI001EF50D9E|nr:hypothetical protein [Pseudoalteromonas sp. CNC9-20]MCG7569188.1 hypothetical protein [Pseudoalteromonas sp. CNC9-20]